MTAAAARAAVTGVMAGAIAGEVAGEVAQLRTLGALELRCGERRLTRFPSRAAAALLVLVAQQPHRAHPREVLVDLLWPGAPHEAGRNRLRQALSVLNSLLRSAGCAGFLLADRTHIRARTGLMDIDVQRFDSLLRSGQLLAARATYGGDFMPGHYEDWVLEERQRLATLYERLDQALVASALQGLAPAAATAH